MYIREQMTKLKLKEMENFDLDKLLSFKFCQDKNKIKTKHYYFYEYFYFLKL
jgi:hypothetical protein